MKVSNPYQEQLEKWARAKEALEAEVGRYVLDLVEGGGEDCPGCGASGRAGVIVIRPWLEDEKDKWVQLRTKLRIHPPAGVELPE